MTLFTDLSDAIADQVESAAPRVAALQMRHGRHLTATLWRDDLAIASEQTLPRRDTFPVTLPGGVETEATVLGRDDGTNIALLRLAISTGLETPEAGTARTGALALAIGARKDGTATACLGVVNSVGPAWHSQHGGRIDAYIKVDLGMAMSEEGGPVLDGRDGTRIVGISTFGPRGQVLVIPHATIERVIPGLSSDGHVARGWLGAGLQPVAVPDLADERSGRGFMVMSTSSGGPAEAAGLVPGDIVIAIAGQPVGRISRLASLLGPESIGQPLDLRVLRGGVVQTLSVTVAERPAE